MIVGNTAFTYRGKSIDVRQIGRELGVRYVVEGSVRRTGNQVQMNVQLIDAESGTHVWADRFDTDRANLAQAQIEITGRLARTLNLELVAAASRRIEQERAVDPDARDLVMRARAVSNRTVSVANRQEAQRLFERALEIDPESVDAKIGIANALINIISEGWSSSIQQNEARAEKLLLEALEHDANRSDAYGLMGLLRRLQNRLAESKIEWERVIALDRNYSVAYRQLGTTLMFMGQPEAAIPQIEYGIRLSPHDANMPFAYWGLGFSHLLLGHVEEAIDFLKRARAANPRLHYVYLVLAGALGLKGDLDEARAALAEAIKLEPRVSSFAQWRAFRPWYWNPQFVALADTTLYAGLRRVGFPDE